MPPCPHCGSYVRVQNVVGGCNHGLHLLLSVFTCGAWLIVWLVAALVSSPKTVTRCGACGRQV